VVNGFVKGRFNFTVGEDAPDGLTYICQYHEWMVGRIEITGGGGTSTGGAAPTAAPAPLCGSACSSAEWDLVWSDDFDGVGLNLSKWDYEVDCAGGGNNEMQCYTAREENVRLDGDGHLLIEARAEQYAGSASDGSCTVTGSESSWKCTARRPFTSARLRTKYHASWKYGRFDVRAKLPAGHGMWPAIWLLPTANAYGGWPHSGEIDIMEARGGDVGVIGGTLHYGNAWPNNQHAGAETSLDCISGGNFTAKFHVYSVVWTEEAISWLVDGVVFHTEQLNGRSFGTRYDADGKPFDQDFHFILNVAIGGNYFGTAGVPVADVQLLQPAMQVDYVRVYQPAEGDTGSEPEDTTNDFTFEENIDFSGNDLQPVGA
jgi:beta-glucanase (GH16 family)